MSQVNDCVPTYNTSPLFCDDAADITFQSSDGVFFKIYHTHLQTSAGFAIPVLTVDVTPIPLEEPESVLEILFQFVHPPSESKQHRQPSVKSLEPQLFFAIAEAAEKYIIYGAMNIFLTRMEYEFVHSRPIEVLNHAYKHDYPELANKAANSSLTHPLKDITRGLTQPGLLQKWLEYYGRWRDVVLRVDDILDPGLSAKCPRILQAYASYAPAIHQDPRKAAKVPDPMMSCTLGRQCRCPLWIAEASREADRMIAAIPNFSAIKI